MIWSSFKYMVPRPSFLGTFYIMDFFQHIDFEEETLISIINTDGLQFLEKESKST